MTIKFRPILFLLLALLLGTTLTPRLAVSAGFPKAEGIDVDTLAADPFAFKGEIKIRGGVMAVDPAKKLFTVIDYREYRSCGVVDCARRWVTVLSDGKLPAVKDVVEVTGAVEKNADGKGGFALRAKGVTVK